MTARQQGHGSARDLACEGDFTSPLRPAGISYTGRLHDRPARLTDPAHRRCTELQV